MANLTFLNDNKGEVYIIDVDLAFKFRRDSLLLCVGRSVWDGTNTQFKRAEKKAPGGGALFKFNLTIKGGTFIVKRRIII